MGDERRETRDALFLLILISISCTKWMHRSLLVFFFFLLMIYDFLRSLESTQLIFCFIYPLYFFDRTFSLLFHFLKRTCLVMLVQVMSALAR